MSLRFAVALSFVALACSGRFDFDSSASGGTGSGGVNIGVNTGFGGVSGGGRGGVEDDLACYVKCGVIGLQCQLSNDTCVECTVDSHCTTRDDPGVCSKELGNRCVRCESNMDCGERAVCVDGAHTCSPACNGSDDRACNGFGPRPSCNKNGYCEGCRSDDDCAGFSATPHCSTFRVGCVGCNSEEQCPSGKFCDPADNVCVSCRDSRDCPAQQSCDAFRHTCGEPG